MSLCNFTGVKSIPLMYVIWTYDRITSVKYIRIILSEVPYIPSSLCSQLGILKGISRQLLKMKIYSISVAIVIKNVLPFLTRKLLPINSVDFWCMPIYRILSLLMNKIVAETVYDIEDSRWTFFLIINQKQGRPLLMSLYDVPEGGWDFL